MCNFPNSPHQKINAVVASLLFGVFLHVIPVVADDDSLNERPQLKIVETENEVVAYAGERVMFQYNIATIEPPNGMSDVYRRSGYLHPIRTPSGKVVTGDFAPDHAHQHAFFMAWVNTKFKQHSVDFWNQKKQTGRISHDSVEWVRGNQANPAFKVALRHEDITQPEKPSHVLSETWQISLIGAADGYFVFDFESNQICVADSPLKLLKHVYGGLGLRGNNQWILAGSKTAQENWEKEGKQNASPPPSIETMGHQFLTSEGLQRHNGNHTNANWVTIYGPINGELAGIAIIGHTENFRHPQPVRLHPHKPYFSYSPVVAGPFQIDPGQNYRTRFRIVSYDGAPNAEFLDQQFELFNQTTATK